MSKHLRSIEVLIDLIINKSLRVDEGAYFLMTLERLPHDVPVQHSLIERRLACRAEASAKVDLSCIAR